MSFTNESNNEIVHAWSKDDFPLSQLIVTLNNNRGLVHIDVDPAFSKATTDSSIVASDADWEMLWAAIAKINAPVACLIEPSSYAGTIQLRAKAGTVIAAIKLVISIAEKLWHFSKNICIAGF